MSNENSNTPNALNALDLISRQAAIDAVGDYIGTFDAIDANFLDGLKTAKKLMMQLPSAQPELIRCKDCKYNLNNPRPYADDDPIETFIHCQFMDASDFCSKGKRMEMEGEYV